MPDFENIRSRQYRPDPEKCCSACVFGEGEHAEWCGWRESTESSLTLRDYELIRRNLLAAMGSDL